ncbi:hypothetical protein EG68_05215 [Paragonimus skrjabini miyazakii]|uniref:LIM zinc-binding domain-containing protein n=1 Tax=Paragonimus skrjabini miyazakii TaxID=59628 RepID=A0A8S9YWS3_9TREM|nr:hypothetical protein EG68_05215 [Paragonimus skrjabini miyazakii]
MIVHCRKCGEVCKGDVLKAKDAFYHYGCFTCEECSCFLAMNGYYENDGYFYCRRDFRKLNSKKCEFFHHKCFYCSACKSKFTPGIRVTYWGNNCYCAVCFPKIYAKKETKKLIAVSEEVTTTEKEPTAIRSNPMLPVDSNYRHRTETSVTSNLSNQTSTDLCSHFCQELSERLAVQYSACQKHISEGISIECSKGDGQTNIPEHDEEVENTGISKADSIQIAKQTKNNELKSNEASMTIRCSSPSNQINNTVTQLHNRYSPHPGSPSFRSAHTCNRSDFGAVPVPKNLQNGRVAAAVKRLEELSTLQLTVPIGNPTQPSQNDVSKTTSYSTGCSRSLDRFGSTKRLDHQHNRPVRLDKCCNDPQTANVASTIHQRTTEVNSQLPSFESPKTFSRPRLDPQAKNEKPGYQSTPFTQANYPLSSCIRKDWPPADHLLTHPPTSRSKVDQREYLKTQPPASSNEQPLLNDMMEQEQSELVARLLKKNEVANLSVTTKDSVIEKSDLQRNLEGIITEDTENISYLTQCSRPHLTCPRKHLTALVHLRCGKSGQSRRRRLIQTVGETVLKKRKKRSIVKSSSASACHSPLYNRLSIMQLLGRLFLSIICLVSLLSALVWIAEQQTENYDTETDPLWEKAWLPKSSEDMLIANKLQM